MDKKEIAKRVGAFFVDSLLPIVIVIIAIVVSTTPTIGNFRFDTNSIMLSLFSLLAIDSILDKVKTKSRIIDKVNNITEETKKIRGKAEDIAERVSTLENDGVLKKRSDFERLEHIFTQAKNDLFVSGVNLEGIVPSCSIIKKLANENVHIRLLTLDPDGKRLAASSDMSGVSTNERKKKIKANLDFLKREFQQEILTNKIEIRILDNVLPLSFIGIDIQTENSRLIVQNYLFKTPSSQSLMLEFTNRQPHWYNLYMEQLELIWKNGKTF